MRVFLMVAGGLACLIGGALLGAPDAFYSPTGIALSPLAATVAQAHGATLLGLGVLTWMARNTPPEAVCPVLAGNLVVQVLSFLVALRTMSLGPGMAVVPALVIHIVLGGLFATFLLRVGRSPSGR